MVPRELFCLLPHTHFLATSCETGNRGRRKTELYPQASILKHRISILATGPSLQRASWGLDGVWSPKQSSKPGRLSAHAPEFTCDTIYDKQGWKRYDSMTAEYEYAWTTHQSY